MNRTRVDWENVSIYYSPQSADIKELFELEAEDYLELNAGKGLDSYAVMDKCINILIDFLEAALIKSVSDVRLEGENGNYTFYFSYTEPENPEKIYVGVNMEVLE